MPRSFFSAPVDFDRSSLLLPQGGHMTMARKLSSPCLLVLPVLFLAACGGGSPSGPTGGRDWPPAPPSATFSLSNSSALSSVTELVLTANSGGLASYDWDFGDGNRGTGQTVRKTYEHAGSYQVALRVTDARGASANSSSSIVVKSLDALWDDDFQQYGVKMTQTGKTFRGRTVFRVRYITGATTGSVDDNRRVTYSTDYFPGVSDTFVGQLDSSLDRITGKLTLNIFGAHFSYNMNFVRK